MKKLLLILPIFLILLFPANAALSHPQAHFDQYGLPYYSSINDYQEIVGKTVMYIPEHNPSYDDKEKFQKAKGKFNTPYIITKVKGAGTRMTVYMTEKDGKAKTKMVINNKNEYYSFGKYTYCITREYTVPLLLIDDLNADKEKFIDQKYPKTSNTPDYEITDLKLHNAENKGYPSICYEVTEISTNNKFYASLSDSVALNMLGMVFINKNVKASYKIVGLQPGKYTIENSITKERKEISRGSSYEVTKALCFKDDLSGSYIATLSNVEKPENPDIRYGETKKIDDANVTKFSYTDSHIEIIIFASSEQFNFTLKNISDNSLKVVWNEAVFVDYDGTTSKIMHVGTKYSEKNGDQPATTIIKGAKIDDIACPTKNVSYSDLLKKWVTDPLLPSVKQASDINPIRLMLPIQIKNVINEYVFEFKIDYIYKYPERLNLE